MLPQAGGLLDQDEGLMELMSVCAYAADLAERPLSKFDKADVDYCNWLLGDD